MWKFLYRNEISRKKITKNWISYIIQCWQKVLLHLPPPPHSMNDTLFTFTYIFFSPKIRISNHDFASKKQALLEIRKSRKLYSYKAAYYGTNYKQMDFNNYC